MSTQQIGRELTIADKLAQAEGMLAILIRRSGGAVEFTALELAQAWLVPREIEVNFKPSSDVFVARLTA